MLSTKKILLALSFIFVLIICERVTCYLKPVKTPTKSLIYKIKNEDFRNPSAQIYQPAFYRDSVEFAPQYCCDIRDVLSGGGLAGRGIGGCIDFFTEGKNEKIVSRAR